MTAFVPVNSMRSAGGIVDLEARVIVETRVDRFARRCHQDRGRHADRAAWEESRWRSFSVEKAREAQGLETRVSQQRGWYEDHDNMVKRDFDPLFERLAELPKENPDAHTIPPRVLTGMRCGTLRFPAGSMQASGPDHPDLRGHATTGHHHGRYGHLFKSEEHKEGWMRSHAVRWPQAGSAKSPVKQAQCSRELIP